ncbi:MAG: hypothetical protein WCK55_03915 [Verrucomicrobiota bacterium]|nr:MAG: hypothetical protein DVB27_11175 [Verrucomicrobiota bacterium]
MKRLLTLIASLFILCSAQASDVKVEAVIAVDGDTKPATSFASDTPKLHAFFRSKGTEKGDKLRGVWIAEDVGDAAPANTKIDEATVTANEDNFHGAFSLSKPTKGWPVGKYKVEIYDEDELVATVRFTITAGK